jgi:hypothetical protein
VRTLEGKLTMSQHFRERFLESFNEYRRMISTPEMMEKMRQSDSSVGPALTDLQTGYGEERFRCKADVLNASLRSSATWRAAISSSGGHDNADVFTLFVRMRHR